MTLAMALSDNVPDWIPLILFLSLGCGIVALVAAVRAIQLARTRARPSRAWTLYGALGGGIAALTGLLPLWLAAQVDYSRSRALIGATLLVFPVLAGTLAIIATFTALARSRTT